MVKPKKLLLISFLCVILINIVVFYPSFYHVARSDQLSYLNETASFNTLNDLINYSFSYTRTRFFNKGDEIYFRPLLYIGISVERYFFKYHFMYWQMVGLLLHLVVAGFLIKLLNKIRPDKGAPVLFALFFSLLYLSADMVIWHHVNMYMLCFIFILASLLDLIPFIQKNTRSNQSLWPIVFYLTLASLLNEFGLVASALIMVVLFYYRTPKTGIKNHPFLLAIPIIVYFYLSILDYTLRFPVEFLLTTATSTLSSIDFAHIAGNFLIVLSMGVLLPFLPGFFSIYPGMRSTAIFSFEGGFLGFWAQYKIIILANSIFLLIVCAFLIYLFKGRKEIFRELRTSQSSKERNLPIKMLAISILFTLSYMGILVLSRGTQGFLDFLSRSLYHFYPICLFLTIAGYCFFCIIDQAGLSHAKIGRGIVITILCLGASLNALRLVELNLNVKDHFAFWRGYIQQVEKFVQQHKHEPDFSFDYGDRTPASRLKRKTPNLYGTARDYLFLEYIDINNPKYYFVYSVKKNN